MGKLISLLIAFFLFSCSQLMAQQYTADEYWKMENDPAYTSLLHRQQAGESLSTAELVTLTEYKTKLSEYFEKMSDNEKSSYYKNRAKWSAQPGSVNKAVVKQEEDVYAGERSKYTQYLVTSGVFGFYYGTAADYVLGVESNGALAAIPLLTAGASVLIPMLTIKDKNISYNSLALSIHGKAVGGLQGAAFGFLLTGDNDNGKLIVGIATLSSIGLGRLGYVLGRDKPWSQGRVALYSHYGLLMPLEGLAIDAAFQAADPRLYAATSLVFGAGGYLIADRVARKNDFTRGDVTGISTLSTLNGLLGLFIGLDIADKSEEVSSATILIPAVGAIGGTLAGQLWLKEARLTSQQGRNAALGSFGGALIGIGITAIFTPETATPYYVMGYATSMTAYALLVSKYKKTNKMAFIEQDKQSRWNVNLMPQNLLINRKIAAYANANPGKRINYLPAFSATLNF